ncbi:hypothetical protein BDB00DRAFT_936464 [Zychaea mexicana]|uniref:uncharacterized protein n=1 Tax=Zychaea mexicana TaxID=64656 RepID=UPI0022FE6717|nr:uncharacterized protein BDB00DRAFT_936464 [Zychaea mexicana]KAI9497293.1 hypothetical protein BDB00DRAFT_936464 [Zychaea mexicana]
MSKAIDTIERTLEYAQFIDNLQKFHSRKGTTLQSEPILGGQKLDLYKIYNAVMDAGGFDQLGWEEETVWGKVWVPPDELRGPNAHRASTLAGKTFKKKCTGNSK